MKYSGDMLFGIVVGVALAVVADGLSYAAALAAVGAIVLARLIADWMRPA